VCRIAPLKCFARKVVSRVKILACIRPFKEMNVRALHLARRLRRRVIVIVISNAVRVAMRSHETHQEQN
jgi:hypothetical protein